MNKPILLLCLLLFTACTDWPAAPSPTVEATAHLPIRPSSTPTATLPPAVPLDARFYSDPLRLGNATRTVGKWVAPETSLITMRLVEGEYLVEVVGEAGAVPPSARVVIVNMETLAFKLTAADEQGGFRETVRGFPGAHILIKQDSTGRIAAFDSVESMAGTEFITAPGAILQVPFENRDDGRFPVAAGFCCDHFDSPWIFEGSLSSVQVRAGESFDWQGVVTLFSGAEAPPSLGTLRIEAHYASDEIGRQLVSPEQFVAVLRTPSGLAIERTWGAQPLATLAEVEFSWQKEGAVWIGAVEGSSQVPAGFREGRYILFAWVHHQGQLPPAVVDPLQQRLYARCCNGDRLAIMEVGDPAPTRLAATLLADVLSEGSRGGVIAREDQGWFAFSTRAVTHHSPVIPRLDRFAVPWNYQLGPYLPMVGGVDRGFPGLLPAVNFDLSTGELIVRIVRPDGIVDELGPGPLTRLATSTPVTPWNTNVSVGGGSLGEVPQLLGPGRTFAYEFPIDGDYAITLEGRIADVYGRPYLISGTYDVTVADVLDIETAALPGTPFEVGDRLPVAVNVMAGLPASVVYTVSTYHADGTAETAEYTGTANAFGWWDGDGASHLFERPGEYRVDVEARFEGAGNLWVGRMTFGGVIASPDPAIAMHGRRGPDGLTYLAPVWSFDTDYTDPMRDHFQLPYFSGDVLWSTPFEEGPDQRPDFGASNAAIVRSSIQILDPANALAQQALAQVAQFGGYQDAIDLSEMIRGNQIPLITAADPSLGWVGAHPDEIDFWAYLYNAVERPGVRVREIVRGSDNQAEYWRFDDAYHLQSGNGPEGDLPGDFKFIYGGAVLRDDRTGEGEYAIYGSGWVHTEYDDPLGGRVMPPFQGAAGGPSGGPLFTIFDTPVDIFFVPLAVRPGMVLELGDDFRMAGPIMPALQSQLVYTVTSPDGKIRSFAGRANAVGYFYQPADDFVLDQTGDWLVSLTVFHDGMTSAGILEAPYPSGGPLTPDLATYRFFVVESAADRLPVCTDLSELDVQPWHFDVAAATFSMALPAGLEATSARLVATIPGIALADETIPVEDGRAVWTLDGPALNRLVHNLDYLQGLADTITVTFFVQDGERAAAGSLVTHGWHVPLPQCGP